jgi:hypothetical protein
MKQSSEIFLGRVALPNNADTIPGTSNEVIRP